MGSTRLSQLYRLGVKASIVCAAATLGGVANAADWYGTSLDAKGHAQWNDPANWNSTTGVPAGNINFTESVINGKSGSKTVYLDGAYDFSGYMYVDAGTDQSPVVFRAEGAFGLIATGGNFCVGSANGTTARVIIDGGTYAFANEFWVANGNGIDAELTLTNCTVSVDSWVGVGRSGTGKTARLFVKNGARVVHPDMNKHTTMFGIGNLDTDSSSVNELVVDKGGYVESNTDVYVGENNSAILTINEGGTFRVATADGGCRWVYMNMRNRNVTTTINLNGGTLEAGRVKSGGNTGTAVVNFNGGTLKSVPTSEYLIEQTGNMHVNIGAAGGTIDTGTSMSKVNVNLDSGVAGGGTDGGLTVTGRGILVMNGAANYTGETFVKSGVLAITNGFAITGPVKIGRNGAIAVDISSALTGATAFAAGYKIALFSASALAFEETTDDLSTSVFLTGPVVGYTLSSVTSDGRTTVYATITDVTNMAPTRKVTTFIAGPLSEGGDRHVDQDTAYSNGQPANNSYDVVVYPGDALTYIWANSKSVNNRCYGDLVVRGGTVWFALSTSDNYPNLGVKHVAGNGTLKLARIGLNTQTNSTLVVDEHVNVEASTEGVSATQDVWFGGSDRTATVNGDVYVTNGVMKVQNDVTFNGDVTIGAYPAQQSWLYSDGTVFNGDLILEDGATFNCNSKTATFGEHARLVLKGGTLVNTSNIATWPETVIVGGTYTYESVPGNGEYTIAGGRLNVVPPADGTSFELEDVTVADGVNAADVIKITGTQYNWTVAYDSSSGKITATAGELYDSATPNYWVGGAQGMWTDAANWSRGVPTIDQTVEFTYDAVCFYDKKQDIFGQVGKLVLNGHNVTVAAKNYDKQYWGGLRIGSFDANETGTLNIWKAGIWTKNGIDLVFPATMKLTVAGTGSDCWLRDDHGDIYVDCPVEIKESDFTLNLDYNVHLRGGASGSGRITARYKADRHGSCRLLGGDWTGFTGTYTGNGEDRTRFLDDFTGSESAAWTFNQYIRFDHDDGVVKFGQVTFDVGRHIEVISGSSLVIEVGGLNGDPLIGSGTCLYTNDSGTQWADSWTQGSTTVTIKKVGTGTMTCGLVSHANIDVAKGSCALASGDANVNVTVREGATLYATETVTVGNVVLDPGSSVMLATLENVPLITANSVSLSNATVTLADGIADALLTQTDPDGYTLLTATTLTGTPSGSVVAQCDATGFGWYVRKSGESLKLMRCKPLNGFFTSIR